MKKILLLLSLFIITSCSNEHPDYASNKKLAEKWVETFETQNMGLWEEVVSEDVVDVSPMYGMGQIDYASSKQIAEFYVNSYSDVKFNNPVWLPGIDTLTMKPDGSVRAYGVWTGKSKSTGRIFTLPSYHNFGFKDGKIISTGEYFDANDLAINLSYARKLTNKFSMGGNIKYIRQNIWHANANSIAADLGALFITPFKDIRLGASLSNYGSDMQMSGRNQKFSVDPDPTNEGNVEFVNAAYETDKFPLPLIFRVGLSGEIINSDFSRLTFAIDALHPNDNVEWVNLGLEFASRDMFFYEEA